MDHLAEYIDDLAAFITASPSSYHAAAEVARRLDDEGFTPLAEDEEWPAQPGGYYTLRDGDLVTLDFAVSINGWVADSAVSFVVGTPRDEDLALIDTTERALEAAIAAAQSGSKVGDISAAIAAVARGDGLSINTDFGGHGVGRTMHGDPHIPNDGRAGRGFPLKPGLVVAIEPWFLQTTDKLVTDERDGWTLRSADGSRGAHSEHTIAITEDGPIVLTAR